MRSPRSIAWKMRVTAAFIFASKNGSLSERRRGWRKAVTSSAPAKPLRFSSSTMQGSPQMSFQTIVAFLSAHGAAMVQRLFKFCGERSSVEGGVNLGVVVEVNIYVAFSGRAFLI